MSVEALTNQKTAMQLLKTILQSLITTAFASVGQFEVLYDPTTFSISIKVAMGSTVIHFWLFSDKEIATLYNGLWSLSGAGAFDRTNPASPCSVRPMPAHRRLYTLSTSLQLTYPTSL